MINRTLRYSRPCVRNILIGRVDRIARIRQRCQKLILVPHSDFDSASLNSFDLIDLLIDRILAGRSALTEVLHEILGGSNIVSGGLGVTLYRYKIIELLPGGFEFLLCNLVRVLNRGELCRQRLSLLISELVPRIFFLEPIGIYITKRVVKNECITIEALRVRYSRACTKRIDRREASLGCSHSIFRQSNRVRFRCPVLFE